MPSVPTPLSLVDRYQEFQDKARALKRKAEYRSPASKRPRIDSESSHFSCRESILIPPPVLRVRLRLASFSPPKMQSEDSSSPSVVLMSPRSFNTVKDSDALPGSLLVQTMRSHPFDPQRIRNDVQAYRAEVDRRGVAWKSFTRPIRSLYDNLKVSLTDILRYHRFTAEEPRPEWIAATQTPRFVEVIPERAARVEFLFETAQKDPTAIVAEVEGVTITKRDLSCLRAGEWLNDEVINCYMNLLNARSRRLHAERKLPLAYHWSTFFYSSLTAEDSLGQRAYTYDRVRRWTSRKRVDLFAMDLIFLPIHVNKIHWALGCIDLRSRLVFFFDSLGGEAEKQYFTTLLQYLNDEHQDKKGSALPDRDKWMYGGNNFALSTFLPRSTFERLTGIGAGRDTTTLKVELPHQDNGSDCGVFACQYAESLGLLRFPFEFTSHDIHTRRQNMALQIMQGSIDP